MKHRVILSMLLMIAIFTMLFSNKEAFITFMVKTAIDLRSETRIQSLEHNHFIVYYESGQENIISNITNLLSDMEDEQEKWFPDLNFEKKLPIFLLTEKHPLHAFYFENTKKGIYYVDLKLVFLNAETYAPANNLVHEYAHYLLDEYFEQNNGDKEWLPMWLKEGFANSFEWFVTSEVSESVWQYDPTPFSQLANVTNDNRTEVYSQGFHAVLDFLHYNGYDGFRELLLKSKDDKSFASAFETIANVDYYSYHERFTYDRQLSRYFHELANNSPEQLIEEAEAYLNEQPAVHPLTADLTELLYKAHHTKGNSSESLSHAKAMSSMTRDVYFLLDLAMVIGESEPLLKARCIEKAIFYSKQANLDQEHFLQQVQEIVKNE